MRHFCVLIFQVKTFAVVENGSSHIPKPYEVVQHIKTYVAHQANWLSLDGPNFEFHISSVTFFFFFKISIYMETKQESRAPWPWTNHSLQNCCSKGASPWMTSHLLSPCLPSAAILFASELIWIDLRSSELWLRVTKQKRWLNVRRRGELDWLSKINK